MPITTTPPPAVILPVSGAAQYWVKGFE